VLFVVRGFILGLILPSTIVAKGVLVQSFPLSQIRIQTISLEQRGDQADIYYPFTDNDTDKFPIVAVLQGALVDKRYYRQFGIALAQQGFVVVIPNHRQELVIGPPGTPPTSILFPDQLVINDVLNQMEIENKNSKSSLFGIIDIDYMGVVGHSAGGAAGLFALEGSCNPSFCSGEYKRPQALKVGAFYGANTCFSGGKITESRCIDGNSTPPNPSGGFIDVQTNGLPVALVQGSLDAPEKGTATFEILDGPRKLITIDGASHYGITDVNNPPGANPDLTSPGLAQAETVKLVATAIGDYLSIHLGFRLSLSTTSNRSNIIVIKKAVLSGDAFSFLTPLFPNSEVKEVEFFIDGDFINNESSAPYDLNGTHLRGYSRGFNTEKLFDGFHTLDAVISFLSGGNQTISNKFETLNYDFKLYASHSNTRSEKFPLQDAIFSDNACIFLMPLHPSLPISSVDYFIDNSFVKREWNAPYDIKGTHSNGNAIMFDSFAFRNGTHRVSARIQFSNGRRHHISSVFEISN